MTQGFIYFPLEEPFVSSHPKLLANDRNALTWNADTSFPASPLEGMVCVRTDENKIYSYRSGEWKEIFDFSDVPLKTSYGTVISQQLSDLESTINESIGKDVEKLNQAIGTKAPIINPTFTNNVAVTKNASVGGTLTVTGGTTISGGLTVTGGSITGSLNGNAATASKLATARTISTTGDATWSVSFDGSGNVSGAITLVASGATAGTYGPSASATLGFSGTINIPQVTVDAKGRVTGIKHFAITLPPTPTTITGNAGTATALQTARTIALSGAVTGTATSFNGTANITIPTTSVNGAKVTGVVPAATNDGAGNQIDTTYATKTELSTTDELAQSILAAFQQFNEENGIT